MTSVEELSQLKTNIETYLTTDSTKVYLSQYEDSKIAKSHLTKHLALLFKADIKAIQEILDELL
jgi:hypothetical protein